MIYNKSYRNSGDTKTRLTIDEFKAKEIARKFLEQYHSIIVSDVLLEDEVWTVSAKTGLMPKDVKKVMIDVQTGRILGYI